MPGGLAWRQVNCGCLTDFLTSQNVAQGNFIVGSHAQIETHVRQVQKILSPISIPLLRHLRHQAINTTL